jgi:phospholipase/carboxylesterase
MNRIQPFPTTQDIWSTQATTAGVIRAAKFTNPRVDSPLAIFAPLHYDPNYAYPLLLWLHGPEDDESQMKRIMPLVSMRNYVALGVRGTVCNPGVRGKCYYGWSQNDSEVAAAEQLLFEGIDQAFEGFNIASSRIFLSGFDTGGTMAFRLAMNHPRRFAGVLSVGGAFPAWGTPLGRLAEARRIPLFVACGRDSRRFPASAVCANLRLFHSAGMNVTLRQYPCGHEIAAQMLSDMDRWMMEQIAEQGQPVVNKH